MWQPFRKEKEANDVFDYQECRWVLEALCAVPVPPHANDLCRCSPGSDAASLVLGSAQFSLLHLAPALSSFGLAESPAPPLPLDEQYDEQYHLPVSRV